MIEAPRGAVSQSRMDLPVSPLQIDGEILDGAVLLETMIQEQVFSHSVATLNLLYADSNLNFMRSKPITFRFGVFPHFGYFWGYVKDVTKTQKFQTEVQVILTCYGYTWQMSRPRTNLWVNRSAKDIADSLALEHRLATSFPPEVAQLDRFAQSRSTDWEILGELGKTSGLFLSSHRGVLRFTDPVASLESRRSFVRLEKSLTLLEPQEKSLMDFQAVLATETDEDELYSQFSYFKSDKTVVSVDTSPPDTPDIQKINSTGKYVNSENSASLIQKSEKNLLALDDLAEARVRGDGRLTPAVVVDVSTGDPYSVVSDNPDGLWFVLSVEHRMDSTLFQTNLKMTRDKYRSSTGERFEFFTEGVRRPQPSMALSNGKWVTTWR